MKTIRFYSGIALLVYTTFISSNPLYAQQTVTDILHDFGGAADTLRSSIRYVYADSSMIITAGNAGTEDSCYIAAFDYAGNVQWRHNIPAPEGYSAVSIEGYENLEKAAPGKYVLGGTAFAVSPTGDTLRSPFLYMFGPAGNMIHYVIQNNEPSRTLTTLKITHNGYILGAGLDSNNEYWLGKFNNDGEELQEQHYSQAIAIGGEPYPPTAGMARATNICEMDNGNTYFLSFSLGTNPIAFCNYIITADNLHCENEIMIPMDLESLSTYRNAYEWHVINKRNSNDLYFMAPATVSNQLGLGPGIYFGRMRFPDNSHNLWSMGYLTNDTVIPGNVGFPWFDSFQYHAGLAEAVNGDMVIQKQAAYMNSTSPAIIRVAANGDFRWGKVYQHIASTTGIIKQLFNATSVAPDGRLVMGGYIQATQPVPGVFDSVGKISWLVVVNDSMNDAKTNDENTALPPDYTSGFTLNVYPNPTSDVVHINLQMPDKNSTNNLTLQLFDINGRLVQSKKISGSNATLDVSAQLPGIYVLKVGRKGKAVSKMIVRL